MRLIAEWGRRVWFLLHRRRFEDELHQEMESHRAMMDDPRRFGNARRLREDAVDVWGWQWLDHLGRDTRFAARTLVRSPGFAAMAILSLALATGATTAIFSVINGVLLRPLPFHEPDRLVQIFGSEWRQDRGVATDNMSAPIGREEIDAYRRSPQIAAMAAYGLSTAHLIGAGRLERLTSVETDLAFFDVLGVPALVGRVFTPADGPDVAVVSAGWWARQFGSDPTVAGRVVILNGRSVTILGVMPPSFQFPYGAGSVLPTALPEMRTDVWLPFPLRDATGAPRHRGRTHVIARLAPSSSVASLQTELGGMAEQVQRGFQDPRIRIKVRVAPLKEVVAGPVRQSLWMLFAAVGLVLAAACANLANLLLARLSVRAREVVTRAALGATPRRLVSQFLVESVLLSVLGGAAGALIARWGTPLLAALAAARIPRADEVALDWQAFAFLSALCVGTALVFGIAPALAATRLDIHGITRESGGHPTGAGGYGGLRNTLVIVEVALAFVLAAGGVTVVRELIRLQRLDNGMATENVLTMHLTPRATVAEYQAIEDRLAGVPGVTAVGLTQVIPLQNWGWRADFSVKGGSRTFPGRSLASLRYVTPAYFRTLGIRVVRGRTFTDQDGERTPMVLVVNETLARRYFPGEDPVGVELDRGVIVGVVADVRQAGLDQTAEPEIYYAVAQNVATSPDIGMSVVLRTIGPPDRVVSAARSAIAEVAPSIAVFNVRTMAQIVTDSLWELRLYRVLIGGFAALALGLAAIGLHGVIACHVTARMHEFAVRLALGAEPSSLSRLVMRRALTLAGVGLAAGITLTLSLAPGLRATPIGQSADAVLYVITTAVVIAIALVACLMPALQVGRVDAASALRHQ